MTEPPQRTIDKAVREALDQAYGINATLQRLPGENLNFEVVADDGRCWVAKVAGDQQPPEFTALEHAALQHASRSEIRLGLPHIHENKFGELETVLELCESWSKRLRVIHFIDGTVWPETTDISENLRFDLGRNLARFDAIMANFDHPEAHRHHRWELARADQHRDAVRLIGEPEKRELLNWAFHQFTNDISPVLNRLSDQFIHGDANRENLLIRGERLIGLVDFGDCCWNPSVCELAIAITYQMMDEPDPWAAAAPVIAGFESVRPLSDEERALLPGLVAARLANTLAVCAERRRIDPDHPNWFVSEAPAWRLLNRLRPPVAAAV
ncbi:phosphotransferase [Elongatibacter sediminis]|uniref:Hydroxylysine kinase n=1 Tax=Elongatibacter sediminis TaxID=3119006 RepID=A0AAW9RAB5_9GAMM